MKNETNLKMNTYRYSGDWMSYVNMQYMYVLDRKIGDVNGDRIPDVVYLIGEKLGNTFYENIKVIVQDGKGMEHYVISLDPEYSMAYDPWLFLGNFTDSDTEQIMLSLPVGGSGGLTYYYILSFLNNQTEYLLTPNQFAEMTEALNIQVIYQDHYKVIIKCEVLNQCYTLDVSDRRDIYEGTVYHKNGQLIKPLEGFMIYQPNLSPIRFGGEEPYKLQAQQEIAGTSRADRLGYMVTYWKYSEKRGCWILDPKMFFVMI